MANVNPVSLFLFRNLLENHKAWISQVFENKEESFYLGIISQTDPEDHAKIIKFLPIEIAQKCIQDKTFDLEKICEKNDPAIFLNILTAMDAKSREDILSSLSESLKEEFRSLLDYPKNTAGALMSTKIISIDSKSTVQNAISKIRRLKHQVGSNIYIVDPDKKLVGRLRLQDLLLAEETVLVDSISEKYPMSVSDLTPKEDIVELVEKNRLTSIPVLNSEDILLGVIHYKDLLSLIQEDAIQDMQKMVGASSEEKVLSSPLLAVKKRIPWLSINLITTFIAAFVVGVFEDTIAKVTALAVLLPVVAGQSGNTGAQAQAITMRGLALREVRIRHKWQIIAKELRVGSMNGLIIGLLCGVSVYIWNQSFALSLVISVSMVLAMVSASLAGAGIPLILSALKQDPAQSSSIILTTVTDIVGFLSFLGLATMSMKYLI